jgi:hypothetical protein
VPDWRTIALGQERWAGAGAVLAIIAVFASTYSAPISEQRHRTLNSFLFFMLSNSCALTAIALALGAMPLSQVDLGRLGALRRPRPPVGPHAARPTRQ